jgi:hypothetical protein
MFEYVMTPDFGHCFRLINCVEQLRPDKLRHGRVKKFKAMVVVIPVYIFVALQQVPARAHMYAYPVWPGEDIGKVAMEPMPA